MSTYFDRLRLFVDATHRITGRPATPDYIDAIALHLAKKLDPRIRESLGKGFHPEATTIALTTLAQMMQK